MGNDLILRLPGVLFVATLMVSLMLAMPSRAQETVPPPDPPPAEQPPIDEPRESPSDQHHHQVDDLMSELRQHVDLREGQDTIVLNILSEELAETPDEEWEWSAKNREFNQRVEEVLDEDQQAQFQAWLEERDESDDDREIDT